MSLGALASSVPQQSQGDMCMNIFMDMSIARNLHTDDGNVEGPRRVLGRPEQVAVCLLAYWHAPAG